MTAVRARSPRSGCAHRGSPAARHPGKARVPRRTLKSRKWSAFLRAGECTPSARIRHGKSAATSPIRRIDDRLEIQASHSEFRLFGTSPLTNDAAGGTAEWDESRQASLILNIILASPRMAYEKLFLMQLVKFSTKKILIHPTVSFSPNHTTDCAFQKPAVIAGVFCGIYENAALFKLRNR